MPNRGNRALGYGIALAGLVLVSLSAADYLFGWDRFSSGLTAVALALVGSALARPARP